MADTKLSALTELTAPVTDDDDLLVTNDPDGTPESRAVPASMLRDYLGGLIARTVYDPATSVSYSTTSSTFADVDATNLAVTFTVPASGAVLVKVSLLNRASANGNHRMVGLREGTTDIRTQDSGDLNGGDQRDRREVPFYVGGLTPGASHTYKLSFASSGNTHEIWAGQDATAQAIFSAAEAPGPIVMEVFSA